MRGTGAKTATLLAVAMGALGLLSPGAAAAPKRCGPPGAGDWERATPAQAGMDAAKLQDAIDYGTTQSSFAVRVFRYGCLVGEDRGAPANQSQTFQSWSMAKSLTAMTFMRAMTQHLISPEDPLGSLIREADRAHGAITMRNLLTMTSGLHWNGFRDYNIFMPNRLQEALTVPVEKRRGTYYEYSQSGPALLAESVGRAVGIDFQAYLQRELLTPLGIEPGSWRWGRDRAGHTQGFFDLHMTPNDYARLGELLRRGGVWRGRRLLSRRVVKAAITPTKTNGCYGWMIWLNRAKPCVGPRVQDRPVSDSREFPELPVDLYHFSGLFGQLVAVFPSQKIVVVRLGQEADPAGFAGGGDYQNELFKRVLAAVTDQRIPRPGGGGNVPGVSRQDVDRGFQTAILDPDTYSGGMNPPPLPPAGPNRARAIILEKASRRVRPGAVVPVSAHCPRLAPRACRGTVRLRGAPSKSLRLAPGKGRILRFRLRGETRRRVLTGRRYRGKAVALAPDAANGTRSTLPMVLRPSGA